MNTHLPKPYNINLGQVDPQTFSTYHQNVVFTGKVLSTTAWHKGTNSFNFTLTPLPGHPGFGLGNSSQRTVSVTGRASREVSENVAVHDELIVWGSYGACEEVRPKAGGQQLNLETKRFRVAYKKQICFFKLDTNSGDYRWHTYPNNINNPHSNAIAPPVPIFHYSASQPSSSPEVDRRPPPPPRAATPQPDPFQSTASTQSPPRSEPAVDSSSAEQAPAAVPVPAKRPAAAAPGEGKRSKKAQKRDAGFDQIKWGLEVNKFGRTFKYLTLDSYDTIRGGNQATIAVATVYTGLGQSTRGSCDWTTTLNLFDPTMPTAAEPIKCNLFAHEPAGLPPVEDGDVIVFTRINVAARPVGSCFVGYKGFQWALLRAADLNSGQTVKPVLPVQALAGTIGQEEIEYARKLSKWWQRVPGAPKQVAANAAATAAPARSAQDISRELAEKRKSQVAAGVKSGRQLITIAEMNDGTFCDTVAMVLKYIKPPGYDDRRDLYISDYTTNDDLYEYNEASASGQRERNGPWPVGQKVLQVSVWGQECEVLDRTDHPVPRMIHIRNLQPRGNGYGLLEARVSDKGQRPGDRRLITVLKEGEYKQQRDAIVARIKNLRDGNRQAQQEHEQQQPQQQPPQPQVQPQPPRQQRPAYQPPQEVSPVQQRAPPPPAPARVKLEHVTPIKPRLPTPADEPESDPEPEPEPESVPVPVRRSLVEHDCENEPLRPLSLVTAHGVEATYKIKARIVDFAPAKLQDWVLAHCPECNVNLGPMEQTCMEHRQAGFSFRFFLALEETPLPGQSTEDAPSLVVTVQGHLALDLLPGLYPTQDMREGGQEINKIRTHLGALLGNLEQAKRRRKGTEPLDESAYGVEAEWVVVRGKDRQGRFGCWFESSTTINPQ